MKSCYITSVHELFKNVSLIYGKELEKSIKSMYENGILHEKKHKKYYNYILLDAGLLRQFLEGFDSDDLCIREVTTEDLEKFKCCIIYIGKGCGDRKYIHLYDTEKMLEGKLQIEKRCAKYNKISQVWKKGEGVVPLQLCSDSDHYLALCRENSMIKAVGAKLTNLINGSIYGIMKNKWTIYEIKNFGDMLLYFALKQCIILQKMGDFY